MIRSLACSYGNQASYTLGLLKSAEVGLIPMLCLGSKAGRPTQTLSAYIEHIAQKTLQDELHLTGKISPEATTYFHPITANGKVVLGQIGHKNIARTAKAIADIAFSSLALRYLITGATGLAISTNSDIDYGPQPPF
jgi:hypothetical protein